MLKYISNTDHYKDVLSRVQSVKHMLWIGTADIKDLYIEMGKENILSKRGQKEFVLSAEWEKGRAKPKMPFLALL